MVIFSSLSISYLIRESSLDILQTIGNFLGHPTISIIVYPLLLLQHAIFDVNLCSKTNTKNFWDLNFFSNLAVWIVNSSASTILQISNVYLLMIF